jgi:NAD(P)-dependent dehydrogenase (short-subunit alcohol dehydrogenase family)
MPKRILIVGGAGHIGGAVVDDLAAWTDATLILAGRTARTLEARASRLGNRGEVRVIDLDREAAPALQHHLTDIDLAVLCVGPFRSRPPSLLLACLATGVNYVDVCDDRRGTEVRLALHESARRAGVTALIDTGTFPGIDNVLAADILARRPDATELHLAFLCAGSGGGGFGVLQTTFHAVSRPFEELHNGRWVQVPSYSHAAAVDFGPPLGVMPVYPFEVPEIWSLAQTFPQLRTVTSRFGTKPAIWNLATQGLARAPEIARGDPEWLDLSARVMLPWVQRIDPLVGHALAVRVEVCGPGYSESATYFAESTTEAVGWATGAAVQLVLDGTVAEPGVLLPETHLPPGPYLAALTQRGGRLTRRVIAIAHDTQASKRMIVV